MARVVFVLAMVTASVGGGCSSIVQSCPAALLTGVLAEHESDLVVVNDDGGMGRVRWPDGHSVRADGDTLVLTNFIGMVVAREGDTVRLGGGVNPERPDAFEVCGQFEVAAPDK